MNKMNPWKITKITTEQIRDDNVSELDTQFNSINAMELCSYKLRLARTLYNNFYRARVQNANGEEAGQLLIVPGLALDRSLLPENAPVANPYLLVIVEDANINKDSVADFEECVARAVLKKFKTETIVFNHCEFYYPSPAFYFANEI